MSIISSIIQLPQDQRKRVIVLAVVLVLSLVLFLFVILFEKSFFSQEKQENTFSGKSKNENIQAQQNLELDQIAKTLPQNSDENIRQQYKDLDALKSSMMNLNDF